MEVIALAELSFPDCKVGTVLIKLEPLSGYDPQLHTFSGKLTNFNLQT